MSKVLITTDYLVPGDEVGLLLQKNGLEPVYNPFHGPRSSEEKSHLLDGFAGAIVASEPITCETINNTNALKVLARSGVGYDSIDVAAAQQKGIRVCNAPGTNHHSVAELTIGMMIASARKLTEVSRRIRSGEWPRDAGHELRGASLGILGYGPSGKAVAALGVALGMNVLVHTSHPDPSAESIEFSDLIDVVRRADYLSLHTKSASSGQKLVNEDLLKEMKPSAVLINTARGSLVDETTLANALRSGSIAAAALDVFETEPLPESSPLRELDNVLMTSHLAGQTAEARKRAGLAAAQEVIDVLNGREPAHPVDH